MKSKFTKTVTAVATALILVATAGLAGCSKAKSSTDSKVLKVYAAASLKKTYEEVAKKFEEENPGVKVEFSFEGSQTLVEQIANGADADVFASADEKNMTKAVSNGIISGQPEPFVTNELTIAVSPGNPKGITGLKDLTRDDLKVVVCAEGVPCGNATKKVTAGAGITLKPVSEEQKVTNVLGKVTSGEADAGLVYKTDVKGSNGKAEAVDFAEAGTAVNIYPIAVVKDSKNPDLARKFVDLVLSTKTHPIFEAAGFGFPKK